jgi:hypothetical protein
MDSSVFSRELMTVDLQIRQDQLNSLDQFSGEALGMPQGLIIWNEKRHNSCGALAARLVTGINQRASRALITRDSWVLTQILGGFFWP